MVTGLKAFEAESPARVMSAILRDEPARVSSVVPITPAGLDELIHTCLAKNPDERWQGMSDVARQLRWLQSSLSAARVGRRRSQRGWQTRTAAGRAHHRGDRGGRRNRRRRGRYGCAVVWQRRGSDTGAAPCHAPAARWPLLDRRPRVVGGWTASRLCRGRCEWRTAIVGPRARFAACDAACGHQRCERSVLVARGQRDRVLRRQPVEADPVRGWHSRRWSATPASAPAARGTRRA